LRRAPIRFIFRAIFHGRFATRISASPRHAIRFSAFPTPMTTVAVDQPRILIIDDEIGPRESLRMLLKTDYQVFTADSVEAGLNLLKEKNPDTIVMDIRMPGTTGIEGLRKIRDIDPDVSVIMLTGFGALDTAKEALRLGANDYLSKPFDASEMRSVVSRYVERTRCHRQSVNAAAEIKELNNRLLQELAQKERLASLGQASAEFVHDLGNPLTIVWGYVQMLAKRLEKSEGGAEKSGSPINELNIIEEKVRTCRELLTMWSSYGSADSVRHKTISVSSIVRDVISGADAVAEQSGVSLKANICDDPCMLFGDPLQIKRAVQNVIVNAVQACSDKNGTVTITCTRKDFYVDLVVEDNGDGITPAQMQKIFDPYFTTKQTKSGTGLGLYITKKVVEDHHGSIKVDSTPGVGTTFVIRLPLQTT
jgi:signal transduction histidine kinase